MRWIAKLYPTDGFAGRHGALLADCIIVVSAMAGVLVLTFTLV